MSIDLSSSSKKKHHDDILNKFGLDVNITLVGSGGFGCVYKVDVSENCYAIKAVDFVEDNQISEKPTRSEVVIEAMRDFKHERLLNIMERFEVDYTLYMVSNFCKYETLEQIGGYMQLDEYHCLLILNQLLEGLEYLHSQKLIHRFVFLLT